MNLKKILDGMDGWKLEGMLRLFDEMINGCDMWIGAVSLDDNVLRITLNFGNSPQMIVELRDDGRSCCESRYMTTDDDLPYHVGAKLLDMEILSAPDIKNDADDVHEMQFLHVRTTKGVITLETHNEHNGYYGGFKISMAEVELPRKDELQDGHVEQSATDEDTPKITKPVTMLLSEFVLIDDPETGLTTFPGSLY